MGSRGLQNGPKTENCRPRGLASSQARMRAYLTARTDTTRRQESQRNHRQDRADADAASGVSYQTEYRTRTLILESNRLAAIGGAAPRRTRLARHDGDGMIGDIGMEEEEVGIDAK